MIEKFFDREYPITLIGPQKATLTWIANRMPAEYKEVFGYDAGCEIKAVAAKIREGEDAEAFLKVYHDRD